ncbi:MAG: hypothetical protein M3Q95_07490 [Bacteroidota bacterium]|nr:hypothetical protein [Bacteroidota bacterium]
MRLSRNILTFIFIVVMMVNAVGIAQVSHICKLAIAGIEKVDCGTSESENHDCCKETPVTGETQQPKTTDCCTDVIKYFQQKLTTTLQPALKIQPLISCIIFDVVQIPDVFSFNLPVSADETVENIGKSGKNLIIALQTFLI